MNTEKFKTLEQLQEALEYVELHRGMDDTSVIQKQKLESIAVTLWNMEQALIRKMGDELISALKKDTRELEEMIKTLKLDSSSLSELTKELEKAVSVTKSLIKIVKIVIRAGLF